VEPTRVEPTRVEPTRVEPLKDFHLYGRLIALSANNKLGCKYMRVVNTLGYFYDTATINAVKKFYSTGS
jgi:hypothetical protein